MARLRELWLLLRGEDGRARKVRKLLAVRALDTLVTAGGVTLFSSSLTLIGTAAILVALDPGLALVTFLSFPVLLFGSLAFSTASATAYRLTREKIALVTAYLQETLSG